MFCCTDIGLGTDKWEIAPDLGWSRSCISGCTGSERCFTAFAAERKFRSPPPLRPRETSLRVSALTAPPGRSLPRCPEEGDSSVTPLMANRPRWAGAGARHPPGSVGAAAGDQSPKNEWVQPWPRTAPQQQRGWPRGLRMLRATALVFPSAPWGAAGFEKTSSPSGGRLVDLMAMFYWGVKARWLRGEMLREVRPHRFPCGGTLQERRRARVAAGPTLPAGNAPSPSPCTRVGLLLKIAGAEKVLPCSSCFRGAVGFSRCLPCPALAAPAWGFRVNPAPRAWELQLNESVLERRCRNPEGAASSAAPCWAGLRGLRGLRALRSPGRGQESEAGLRQELSFRQFLGEILSPLWCPNWEEMLLVFFPALTHGSHTARASSARVGLVPPGGAGLAGCLSQGCVMARAAWRCLSRLPARLCGGACRGRPASGVGAASGVSGGEMCA